MEKLIRETQSEPPSKHAFIFHYSQEWKITVPNQPSVGVFKICVLQFDVVIFTENVLSKSRFKLIPEVHLVLRRDNHFLMLRRYQTGYMDGHYSVVAGHVDGNEAFRTAMVREAYEEAGITLKSEELRLVHTMHRYSDDERLSLFFEAGAWGGKVTNMEPHKCDDLNWYTLAEQDTKIVPYVKSASKNVLDGTFYSEFGWDQVPIKGPLN